MSKFDKARLVVSGLGGAVYIAEILKQPNLMSSTNRRMVPEQEFIDAMLHWLHHHQGTMQEPLEISIDGVVCAKLELTRAGRKKLKLVT